MNAFSPAATGFRLIFRRPAIPLAEIAWRWTLAAAAWFLALMFAFEYFDSLPLTALDRLLLGTGQPILISRAIHRIFSGSALRFTEIGIAIALALVAAWIVLASFGRSAVVNSIARELNVAIAARRSFLPSLLFLNFLRAAVTLAAIACIAGSAMISSSLWASGRIDIETSGRFTTLFWFWIGFSWLVLNWFLSVTCMFAFVERRGAARALGSTMDTMVTRPAAVISLGVIYGVAHTAAFVAAFCAAIMAMTAVAAVPVAGVVVLFVVAMAYCAVADFFYTGRLAGYVSLLRREDLPLPGDISKRPGLGGTAAEARSIDRDELILSDVPAPGM